MYRNCIITIVIINIIVYIVVVMMCLNSQVVVTYLGFCWYSEVTPQSPDCWRSCNVLG